MKRKEISKLCVDCLKQNVDRRAWFSMPFESKIHCYEHHLDNEVSSGCILCCKEADHDQSIVPKRPYFGLMGSMRLYCNKHQDKEIHINLKFINTLCTKCKKKPAYYGLVKKTPLTCGGVGLCY